jgi:glycosyltransferase involved in cell wall biosynthesis
MSVISIIYTFAFSHHGSHSAFHQLPRYLTDQIIVDCDMRLPRWVSEGAGDFIQERWRRVAESRLKRYLAEREPRCFHYLYPENTLYQGWKWKRQHRFVLTCHQPAVVLEDVCSRQGDARWSGFARGFSIADALVSLTQGEVKLLQQMAPSAKVVYIPHGIDIEYFRPHRQASESKTPLVVTVGSCFRDYQTWGNVVRKLLKLHSSVCFAVVATPASVTKARRALGVESPRVSYWSGLSDEALRDLYNRASLMFLPLHNATANNALLESMAMELPVLTTDLEATRNYLGESGIFLSNSDIDAWVEQIVKSLNENQWRQEIGKAGRQRAQSLFNWESIALQYRELYASLLPPIDHHGI